MSSFTSDREETAQTTAHTEGMDARWLTLQRTVAVAMIVVLAAPMVLIAQQVIPPLAILGVLFVVALGFTWLRPRASAITIGVLAGLWLLLQLVNVSQVSADLTQPSAMVSFLITLGMVVVPAAGFVGLIGILRRASGRIAVRTVQVGGIVLLGGVVLGLLATL